MFTRPAGTSNMPVLLGAGAALLATLALAGVVALELGVFGPRAPTAPWLLYVIAIPCYFLLQLFSELILEALWGVPSLLAKAVPVVLLAAFYAAWFVYGI